MARIDDIQSADGTKLAVHRWEPEGEAKADLLLCHGLAEHMGRYEHIAALLTAQGWRVTGLELRGHGDSEGKRGYVSHWRDYVADLRAATALIDGPYVILAHSMGGLVTLEHLRDAGDNLLAAAVCAPLLGATVPVPAIKLAAAKLLSRLLPKLSMVNEIPPDWLCSDAEVVKAYLADPKVFNTVTPRWFTSMNSAITRCNDQAASCQKPLYMFWGTDDKIVDVAKVATFARGYSGSGATARPWEGLLHECLNEPSHEQVLAEAVAFLDSHLSAQ